MSDYVLVHYGVKGMKWGVRRTAAQLGHVVVKGAKRTKSAVQNSMAKHKAKKEAEAKERAAEAERNKPLSKLTDAELKARINRLNLEKQAFDLQRSMSSLDQQKVSSGKKFAQAVATKVIAPAAVNAGREVLERWLKKQGYDIAGLKDTQYGISKLQKEAEKIKTQKEMADNKKKTEVINDWFNEREKKAAREAAEKKVDDEIEKNINKAEKEAKKSAKQAEKKAAKETKEGKKVYTGTVTGEGTSKRKTEQKTSKKPADYYDPIDTDFVNKDEPISNVRNSSSYQVGIDYVRRYLLN